MKTDEMFKDSVRRQNDLTEEKEQELLEEDTERKSREQDVQTHARDIGARLVSSHEHLMPRIEAAKSEGYDIKHEYILSPVNPSGVSTLSKTLTLYMKKGVIAERVDVTPYEADYVLSFQGDEVSGALQALYSSSVSGADESVGSFDSAADLSDDALDEIWQSFVRRSLASDLKRHSLS